MNANAGAVAMLVLVSLVVTACAERAGIREFTAYSDAFEASRAASDGLFDLLAIAERRERLLADPGGATFDPDRATVFATIGDPPLTAAYRNAFSAITRYNSVMVGLASGQTAGELSGDIAGLAAESAGLASLLISGPQTTLTAFEPLAKTLGSTALTFRTRAVFRQELAKSAGDVKQLMQTMRTGSATMFRLLVDADEVTLGGDAVRREAQRRLVSDWVVLIDRNIAALDIAIQAGATSSPGDVAAMRATLEGMRASATAIRTGIAAMASQ